MHVEGDPLYHIQKDMMKLKKSVDRSRCLILLLGITVIILTIALIALGASQGTMIRKVKKYQGLLPRPNVTFATQSGDRDVDGLTYGGSLFRGSGFWSSRTPLGGGSLTDHAVVGAGDYVYIIGGADKSGNVTNEVWKYDPILHNYTKLANMPEPRYRFGADVIDDTIFVVGGRNVSDDTGSPPNNGLTKSTLIYDIKLNKWRKGADALEMQGDCCASALNKKVYMVGGYGINYTYLNIAEVYDPSKDAWTLLPRMPTPRGDLMCAALDGEIYVLGGYYDPTNEKANSFSAKMESFNPTSGKWTSKPDLLTPRGDAGVAVLEGDRIMLVGGEGHYQDDSHFKYPKHVNEVYYAADQTWVQKAMIPTARFRTGAAAAGGLVFVVGGADVCIDQPICPALDTNEIFLDVDHPHVYLYLKNEAYNDNAALTTYPL